MNSYDCYTLRHNLYTKSEALRAELDEAEDADREAWNWYDSLTEEEYRACADEADRKVDETSVRCRILRTYVDEVEIALRRLESVENSLGYLEAEGLI